MAVIVIGGSGKDVGKTALVCAVIAALREFDWTAVKITGHDYEPGGSGSRTVIREETRAGLETDTGRYLAVGARRALLVMRSGDAAPIDEIRRVVGADRNVIFESNRIVDVLQVDVCLALVGEGDRKASFGRLLQRADAVVSTGEPEDVPDGVRRFRMDSAERLPEKMVEWLRARVTVTGSTSG